ncbi:hypothetical protein CYLTODRAFT_411638 [Cylindrobasidium torrendii FP15055 ss-10]|uniref:Uncharacterized protein n=1 Tax=Cylindrobasidium torrendii FP15055 ss-10 TaxID=1314674 RepID=A0A0D7B834_9AGAR|nr:hypothetical protein CYLTODRAFT_411638 [Cylindrobasidium torrendii FP15055 ss-10]
MSTDTQTVETIRLAAVDSGHKNYYYGAYYSEGDERNIAGACDAKVNTREEAELEALEKVLDGITRRGNESWSIAATFEIQTSCGTLSQCITVSSITSAHDTDLVEYTGLVVDLPEYRTLGTKARVHHQVQRANKMLHKFSAPITFRLVPNSQTAPARTLAEDFALSKNPPRAPHSDVSQPSSRAELLPATSASASVQPLIGNKPSSTVAAQATNNSLSLPSVDQYIPLSWFHRWEKDPAAQSRIQLPQAGQLKNIAHLCEKVFEMTAKPLKSISWPVEPNTLWDRVLDILIKVVDAHRPLTHRGAALECDFGTQDGGEACHSGVKRQAEDDIDLDCNAKRQKSESGWISTTKPSDEEVLLIGFFPVLNALLDRISSGEWGGKQPIVNVVYLKGSVDNEDRRLYACIPKVIAKVNTLINKINGTIANERQKLRQEGKPADYLRRVHLAVLEQPDAREKLFGKGRLVGHQGVVFAVRSVTGGHGDLDEISRKEIPRPQPPARPHDARRRKLYRERLANARAEPEAAASESVVSSS